MTKKITRQIKTEKEKEFLELFSTLTQSRNSWEVWADLITVIAISISNSTDKDINRKAEREKEYLKCIERLNNQNTVSKLLNIIVSALEENPEQDFLGELFMKLNLGNHWKGQFFTPYHVCKLMAEINCINTEKIKEKGIVTVNDCACGAGATLIAFANSLRAKNINYQECILFVAQDIDRIAGMMCYIQLSLLGCKGYVVVANSLTNPITGNVFYPNQNEDQEFWFTPMYNLKI